MRNRSVTHKLLSYRLQWYYELILEKIKRSKSIVIFFAILMLAPFGLFDAFLVQPIINIGYPKFPTFSIVFFMLILQAVFLFWVKIQEEAVSAPAVKKYFNALPISSFKHYLVNMTVLLVANNILWIPFLVALFKAPYSVMTDFIDQLLFVLNISALITSIFAMQLQWLYRHYYAFIFLLMVDLLLYVSYIIQNELYSFILSLSALILAALFVFPWRFQFAISKILSAKKRRKACQKSN